MVICLERGADLHMAQPMPLPLTPLASVKPRLVLPFWCRLTRIVPETEPLNGGGECCCCPFSYTVLFMLAVPSSVQSILTAPLSAEIGCQFCCEHGVCVCVGWQDTLDEVDTDHDGMISMSEYLSQ